VRDHGDSSSENTIKPLAKRRCWRRWVVLVLLALFGWQLFFRPLPKPVLYLIVDHAGGWLINQNGDNYVAGAGTAKRLVSLFIEQSLFTQLHDLHPLAARTDDLSKLRQRLELLRPMLINQIQIPHHMILSSTMLTGVGKCSGINDAAANFLAHDFDLVEMIAVDGDNPDNGHSFARLWSPQYKDWLYFDIWTDQIQIFRATKAGAVYLSRTPNGLSAHQLEIARTTKPMHDMATFGHVRTKLQTNFAGYLVYRLGNYLDHGTTWEVDHSPLTQAMTTIAVEPDPKLLLNSYNQRSNLYLHARLDHIFGQKKTARTFYNAVAQQPDVQTSTFGKAANIFAAQLGVAGKSPPR
jgi:hypothetical protein